MLNHGNKLPCSLTDVILGLHASDRIWSSFFSTSTEYHLGGLPMQEFTEGYGIIAG
jgi:hypothetical protein